MTDSLYQDLQNRGLIKQETDPKLKEALDGSPMSFYIGYDPTSDALHVGSLLPLIYMRRLQLRGHQPIAVVGGATGMIGDPSGKSAERSLLDSDTLEKNLKGIERDITKVLDMKSSNAAKIVDNYSWFKNYGYIEFLRDIGKHFTVNHMVTKESVRARLEDRDHGISYTEFSYMLLQAYDFFVLNRDHNCTLQVGGSDQWGNITEGCELIRRMAAAEKREAPQVYGLTMPLLMKSDGTKFGKSESGNVWLDPQRTSPYQFYQFFLNVADADAVKLLNYYSFKSTDEIEEIRKEFDKNPQGRLAQQNLADELTELIHGRAELEKAKKATKALFGGDIRSLDAESILAVFADAPSTKVSKDQLNGEGMGLLDILVQTQLCKSNGQARKDITGGGINLNNERVQDPNLRVNQDTLIDSKYLVLRKGKKNYHLVEFN